MAMGVSSGDFLAIQQAKFSLNDPVLGAYIDEAVQENPENIAFREEAIVHQFYALNMEEAYALAQNYEGEERLIIRLAKIGYALQNNQFFEAAELHRTSEILAFYADNITEAWGYIIAGDKDKMEASLQKAAEDNPALAGVFLYQRAMIYAYLKDYKTAFEILDNNGSPIIFNTASQRNYLSLAILSGEIDAQDLDIEHQPSVQKHILEMAQKGEIHSSLGFYSPQNAIAEHFHILKNGALEQGLSFQVARIFEFFIAALTPENSENQRIIAEYFIINQEYDDVIARAKLNKDPVYSLAFLQLEADALYLQGDAEASLTRVLETQENNDAELNYIRGNAYNRVEDYEQAIQFYDKFIQEIGEDKAGFTMRFSLALAHLSNQDIDIAQAQLRKLLAEQPENPEVLNSLGYLLVDHKIALDEGLDMLKKAVEISPNADHILDSLGWAYYRLENYDEAEIWIERALMLNAVDPTINSHLGDVYWRQGREREAQFQWSHAIEFAKSRFSEIPPEILQEKLDNGLD